MPLEYLAVSVAALTASILTFLSGFGFGTLLMPVFALFFPVPLAISLTALVHFVNSFFQIAFLYRFVDVKAALTFGLPAAVAAYGGARMLHLLSAMNPLATFEVVGMDAEVTPVKLTVALLIIVFASFELSPRSRGIAFGRRYLPIGGLLSGFFGGLSGHQGAPRAAFLMRVGLSKEGYVATGVAVALAIDLSRLSVYSRHFLFAGADERLLLLSACTAALVGTVVGNRVLGKMAFRTVRVIATALLVLVALGLGSGLL